MYLRPITSTLLVLVLTFMTGVSSVAHALPTDCGSGHCDDHMTMIAEESHAGHGRLEPVDGVSHGSNGLMHEECNPFLCNVLALALPSFEAVFDQSEAALAWHVTGLRTLKEPDNPDRPPNF